MADREYQPRYVAYASSQGFDPDTMLAVDKLLWPGGHMVGFMLWISARWSEWREQHGYGFYDPKSDADHASFDQMIGATREESND